VAQRHVAAHAQQPAHALTTAPLLGLAAAVVVVDADALAVGELLAAHPAGEPLPGQQYVEPLRRHLGVEQDRHERVPPL
jgi:hypothetical protein